VAVDFPQEVFGFIPHSFAGDTHHDPAQSLQLRISGRVLCHLISRTMEVFAVELDPDLEAAIAEVNPGE